MDWLAFWLGVFVAVLVSVAVFCAWLAYRRATME
jgi:hypothetical protein